LKGNAFHGIGGEEFCKPRNTETKNWKIMQKGKCSLT